MILTEAEAKTKRCQEAFPAAYGLSKDGQQSHPIATHSVAGPAMMGGAGYAVYSEPTGGAPFYCLGAGCMAWQWKRGNLYVPDPVYINQFTLVEDKGDQARTVDGIALGYCGKARR